MFTGIVETTGKIVSVSKTQAGLRLALRPRKRLGRLKLGESVAVNGVCLTLAALSRGSRQKAGGQALLFDVVPETLKLSNLGRLTAGAAVNLERSLRYGDRLGGHLVLGHVEGTGRIKALKTGAGEVRMTVAFPAHLRRRILPKGCVALDGASLTVARLGRSDLDVCLVPHTLKSTNFGGKRKGDILNIETDMLLNVASRGSRVAGKIESYETCDRRPATGD